jgi:MarR family transcriptional regulator, organic hydroperoxide resistance regulator
MLRYLSFRVLNFSVVDDERRRWLESAPLQRLVGIAGHVSSQRWHRATSSQHGMTSAGASVLLVLAFGLDRTGLDAATPGRATSGDLARRLWITPATMTGIIDNLERDGYVERTRDDADRRQVWISVTAAGTARVRQLAVQLQREFPLTATERDPEKAAIVRQYLIEVIELYYEKEGEDGEAGDGPAPGGGGPRPDQAVPEASGQRG